MASLFEKHMKDTYVIINGNVTPNEIAELIQKYM